MRNRTVFALTMMFLSLAIMMASLPVTQSQVTQAASTCGTPIFSFETSIDDWKVSEGSATLTQSTTAATAGTSALKVVVLTATNKVVVGGENSTG